LEIVDDERALLEAVTTFAPCPPDSRDLVKLSLNRLPHRFCTRKLIVELGIRSKILNGRFFSFGISGRKWGCETLYGI